MSTTLGTKLAALRAARRLTLRQVAGTTGLAESFLSKLEHDRVNISVSNLRKLARTYGVPMTHFFEHEDDRPSSVVVRAPERRRLGANGDQAVIEMLSPARYATVQAVLRTIPAGCGGRAASPCQGEEFTFVLRGRVRYDVGGEAHELAEGDSIYYRRSVPHGWQNAGDEDVVLLTIYSPPTL